MNDKPTDIIAVIPAYQAAATLDTVVRQTLEHLPVLVVDDGSSDDTSAVAEAAGGSPQKQEQDHAGLRHENHQGEAEQLTPDRGLAGVAVNGLVDHDRRCSGHD